MWCDDQILGLKMYTFYGNPLLIGISVTVFLSRVAFTLQKDKKKDKVKHIMCTYYVESESPSSRQLRVTWLPS